MATSNSDGSYSTSSADVQGWIANPTITIGTATVSGTNGMYMTHQEIDWRPRCSYHRSSGEILEYSDGIVISNCEICGDTIQITRFPGGINAIAMKMLLVLARTGELNDESLRKYVELRGQLLAEQEALELAFEQLTILDAMMKKFIECDE